MFRKKREEPSERYLFSRSADAAIHYFSRLVDGGADIQTIGRRLMVIASEDIGMAYPSAVSIVTSCVQAS